MRLFRYVHVFFLILLGIAAALSGFKNAFPWAGGGIATILWSKSALLFFLLRRPVVLDRTHSVFLAREWRILTIYYLVAAGLFATAMLTGEVGWGLWAVLGTLSVSVIFFINAMRSK